LFEVSEISRFAVMVEELLQVSETLEYVLATIWIPQTSEMYGGDAEEFGLLK